MSDTIRRINTLLRESNFAMFGKKKSPEWLKAKDEVLNAKDKKELSGLLNKFAKMEKAKKLSPDELMDLVDKVDQKTIKLKKSGKKT